MLCNPVEVVTNELYGGCCEYSASVREYNHNNSHDARAVNFIIILDFCAQTVAV